MMEDQSGACHVMEDSEADGQNRQTPPQTNNRPNWSNGQCVVTVRSCSMLYPGFDLSVCRAALEKDGFQIPFRDMEAPLLAALNVPSIRRYLMFNSAFFHFLMAPVLYVVLFCAVFSTLHLYIPISDYWVLCLSVSLVSIVLTTVIIIILHQTNKEINVNIDVRLIQVNEKMVKHKLLVAVADWVQNCTGNLQLCFVYWDIALCLTALTEALEEGSFVENDTQFCQSKIKKKMSNLVLVTEAPPVDPEDGGPGMEQCSDEQSPLLGNGDTRFSDLSSERENAKVTMSCSLVPDASLSSQAKAYQLLMSYSAAYVKLLVSHKLSQCHLQPRRNHCNNAPLCLCQYIQTKILQ
ncbi:transmembrane protein 268 isoform X2 [Thalassophryne amazonica]|uniref:transmembrane protein 268 isoform X2 n=1 Tax=Thalassophryne amazonica TaxID=390379 RepID=UPI001471F62D|nr:transmembrane protein 268 isoform X2 [Thalassophryne amazonica]